MNIQFDIGDVVFKVLMIQSGTLEQAIPKHRHSDKSFEVHYILGGFGKLILDDISYDLQPNDLFTTGPHIRHQQIPALNDPMTEYCIQFEIVSEVEALGELEKQSPIAQLFVETPFWLGQDTQNIRVLFEQICYELSHQYLGYDINVKSLFEQMVVAIVRNYEKSTVVMKHIPQKSLDDQRLYIIEESFLNDYSYITASLLAERLGVSVRQMSRILQDDYHMTFKEKKLEARMCATLNLLESSSKDIEAIALEIGFSSLEHFSRSFKKYYGFSATQYRKEYLSKQ